jgi:signal transduction histidine kinase
VALANAKSKTENAEIKTLLSEREGLISSLLKANKTVATGALSASLAHELNQPLGASYLNIQFLQKKLADRSLSAEQNQEVLSALLSDNQRAANIIKSLRSIFSDRKIGATQVEAADLIESVLKITSPEIQSRNIQVVLALASGCRVNVNQSEMQQVILNLVNNAIQALSGVGNRTGTLTIETRNVPKGVELIFSDNGPGISIAAQAHLFELLAGGDKRAGMGLGLWLCQHIITRHSGWIRYEDVPGGGARFIVFLPAIHE